MPTQRSEEQDRAEQQFGQGRNPRPTNAPLKTQSASPAAYATSGVERALGQLADKIHRRR